MVRDCFNWAWKHFQMTEILFSTHHFNNMHLLLHCYRKGVSLSTTVLSPKCLWVERLFLGLFYGEVRDIFSTYPTTIMASASSASQMPVQQSSLASSPGWFIFLRFYPLLPGWISIVPLLCTGSHPCLFSVLHRTIMYRTLQQYES